MSAKQTRTMHGPFFYGGYSAQMFAALALSARDYKKLTTLEPLDAGDVLVLRRGWLLRRALVTRPELAAALACCARLRCRGVRGGI